MNFRKAETRDIPEIIKIITAAQNYLSKQGIDQWQNNYPNQETIKEDIKQGNSYLIQQGNKIVATAAIIFAKDPTYDYIENGDWITEGKYGVIHRAAVAAEYKGQAIMAEIFKKTYKLARRENAESIRIDTHPDNFAMHRAIEKESFKYCGIIYTSDGSKRLAYEKVISNT
ncbi:acetyltransferase (GNAT) family protein [Halanaerobium saccharolyticum]|uniref:Acetyltransferase (GNAT) family protein n=1 Tax=Halanaerobium saccharolyticum TaxID=43595 RepID=A0A4R7Z572_9FIRM|nr:GNAT family N-acetyltransferase [Halanaerobium saccharolyticum]RAK09324.1 acetyltransferase (GNAT) family protein [Halanaerobium saccharolyticum]TDW06183.1 acetyltransferase (GNAT) family protein [Halanaerobium saccharolyticum]TDX60977.1 acetyltransferase (GNAT) family protein [Halanaerobium saccharolyticum]